MQNDLDPEATVRAIGVTAWMRSLPAAAASIVGGSIRHRSALIGKPLRMSDGRFFVPFRETVKDPSTWRRDRQPAVLEPRFHLRGMGSRRRILHAIFRRVCIVTTPFFVGIEGFRTKLWMTDLSTGDYAALYEWDSAEQAAAYAEGLAKVLRLFATRESVACRLVPDCTVDAYLDERAAA
jgi:hypothetical protein